MTHALDVARLPAPLVTPLERTDALWLKWEQGQPSGSVKYRFVYARVMRGLAQGSIDAGTVLMEASQGYAGLALAYVGQRLGLPVELYCGPDLSDARAALLRELGATLLPQPITRTLPAVLAELTERERAGGCFWLGQYRREALLQGYADLAEEVVRQVAACGRTRPRAFICPIGTGGLFQGVGRALRRHFEDMRLIAVEAAPGVHFDGTIRNTDTMYLGPDDPYDKQLADETWFIEHAPTRPRSDDRPWVPSALAIKTLLAQRGLHDALLITPE